MVALKRRLVGLSESEDVHEPCENGRVGPQKRRWWLPCRDVRYESRTGCVRAHRSEINNNEDTFAALLGSVAWTHRDREKKESDVHACVG